MSANASDVVVVSPNRLVYGATRGPMTASAGEALAGLGRVSGCAPRPTRSTLLRPGHARPSTSTVTHAKQEGLLPTIDQQALVEGEPALAQAADDVIQAKVEVREVLRGDTAKTWTFREVQDSVDGWSGTIVSLALMDMRRNGEVEMDNDLSIRVLALQTD